MRISDWSSDVCSSDLCLPVPAPRMSSELLNSVGSTQLRFDSVPDPVVPKCGQIGIEVAKFGIKGKQRDVCATCALGKRLEGNPASRQEERRVGKECVCTGRSRRWTYH